MEHTVTACSDCPFYDSANGEYGAWCNHPHSPFDINVHVTGDEKIDGSCIKEVVVLESEKEYYKKEAHRRSLLSTHDLEKNETWMSIRIINTEIELDKNYNPITPDWCPLKKEPITITLNQ